MAIPLYLVIISCEYEGVGSLNPYTFYLVLALINVIPY